MSDEKPILLPVIGVPDASGLTVPLAEGKEQRAWPIPVISGTFRLRMTESMRHMVDALAYAHGFPMRHRNGNAAAQRRWRAMSREQRAAHRRVRRDGWVAEVRRLNARGGVP